MASEYKCEHYDYDDYFDRCPDCGLENEIERAEQLRDEMREDGIAV